MDVHLRNKAGFTIIELLIAVAIISILATVALPLAELSVKRSKELRLRSALMDIRQAIDAYKTAWDDGRIPKLVDASGYPPNLDVLVEGVVDAKSANRKRIYFLRRIPADPFNPTPTLSPADQWGLRSYASPADAPKPGDDVYDIYSRSDRVGIDGVPYREW